MRDWQSFALDAAVALVRIANETTFGLAQVVNGKIFSRDECGPKSVLVSLDYARRKKITERARWLEARVRTPVTRCRLQSTVSRRDARVA